jgi:hypothetical protein
VVLVAAALGALAVAGANGARVVGAVSAGHGGAGEEKGGEETGELHGCWLEFGGVVWKKSWWLLLRL